MRSLTTLWSRKARLSLLVLPCVAVGCARTGGERGASTPAASSSGSSRGLQGLVKSADGAPLEGVSVEVGEITVESDSAGLFVVPDLAVGSAVPVRASARGYSVGWRAVDLLAERWSYTEFTLLQARPHSLASARAGGKITTDDGVSIDFPAGAVVSDLGELPDAPVTVWVALADELEELRALPYPYLGPLEDGTTGPVRSFGAIDVQLQARGLDMVLGAPALLTLPLSGGADLADGARVTRFEHSEGEGGWLVEGSAEVDGGAATAEVAHFSWHGHGAPTELTRCVDGLLRDEAGDNIVNATIEVLWRDDGKAYYQYITTGDVGDFQVSLPETGTVDLRLTYGPYQWDPPAFDLSTLDRNDCPRLPGSPFHAVDRDVDDDGFPTSGVGGSDCDDDDPAVHPLATEQWYDGADQDCAGDDDFDQDGDGDRCDPHATATGCHADGATSELCPGITEGGGDCDDADAARSAEHAEVCDGGETDEDCDCGIDDEDPESDAIGALTWYLDEDGDCWGGETSVTSCTPPDDAQWSCGRAALLSEADSEACKGAYVLCPNDCQDTPREVTRPKDWYPGAPEDCSKADDTNCDGIAGGAGRDPDGDGDGDGDGVAGCDAGGLTDCDDDDGGVEPGRAETCTGTHSAPGVDDDCDGLVDEEDDAWLDQDGDGHGDPTARLWGCRETRYPPVVEALADDCDDHDSATFPGAAELEHADCATDADDDGYGALSWPAMSLPPEGWTPGTDCQDGASSIHPGADELCSTDGIDDDCDGSADESDAVDALLWFADLDADGWLSMDDVTLACEAPTSYGRCGDGSYECASPLSDDDDDCDDADPTAHPTAEERCDTPGIDDDCDDVADEADSVDASTWFADNDGDGYGDADSWVIACTAPASHVANAADCDDDDSTTYPGAAEWCDGVDHDCDGAVNEVSAEDVLTLYIDHDGDGYGAEGSSTERSCTTLDGYTSNNLDCNDYDAAVRPGVPDDQCDGADDDCDGVSDSDTLRVGEGGTSGGYDFDGVAEAMPYAVDGDILCVAPGAYVGDVEIEATSLTVIGLGGSGEVSLVGSGSGTVVTVSSTSSTTDTVELRGLTIQGGSAYYGGGMNVADVALSLEDVVLRENSAVSLGGGMHASSASVELRDVLIEDNSVGDYGGGIHSQYTDLVIEDSTIRSNTARVAGGIRPYYGTVSITGTTIADNSADFGGGLYSAYVVLFSVSDSEFHGNDAIYAGAMYVYQTNAEITGTSIFENSADDLCGGIYLHEVTDVTLTNVTIDDNTGGYGAGLRAVASKGIVLQNVTIADNVADPDWGGGMHIWDSEIALRNVLIIGNEALESGGGGMYLDDDSTVEISNSTIVGNRSKDGGAVFFSGPLTFTMINSIVADNEATGTGVGFADFSAESTVWVTYSDLLDDVYGVSTILGGTGNISADPCFLSLEAASEPEDWDLRLDTCSPALNAGDPSSAYLDPDTSRNDMGAYGGPGAGGW